MSSRKERQLRSHAPADHGNAKRQRTASVTAAPAGAKSARKPYSKDEDRAILEFLVKNQKHADLGLGGNILYKDMASNMRLRTWQSLKERVKKRLKDHVESLMARETVVLNCYEDGPASFRLVGDRVKLLSSGRTRQSPKARRGPASHRSDFDSPDSIPSTPTSLASDTKQTATGRLTAMEAAAEEDDMSSDRDAATDSKKKEETDLLELVLKLKREAPVKIDRKLVVAALLATSGNVEDTMHLLANGRPREGTVQWSYEMDRQLDTASREDCEKMIGQFGEKAVMSRIKFLA